MPTQESDSSCGGKKVTLRELRKRGNYVVIRSQIWLRLFERMNGRRGFSPPQVASPTDYFSSFIGSALEPEDRRSNKWIVDKFVEELRRVKNDLHQKVKKFMPPEWHDDLYPLGKEVPDDPLQLADLLYKTSKENNIIERPEFEIMRAIVLAGDYFEIKTRYNDWEEEVASEKSRIRAFLKYMFIPEDAAKQQPLDFYLDPGDEWHCRKAETEGASIGRYTALLEHLRKSVLCVNFASWYRKKVRAVVLARRKGYLEAFARRFRDPQSELIPYVPDLFGVRLCYFDKEEMKRGIEEMSNCASLHSSSIHRIVPRLNKHSMKRLHLVSQKLLMNGRYTEIQHMPVKEWLNIEYSTGRENHALYQLRWYSEKGGLFANIFPPKIYGKKWDEEPVRKIMREYVIEQTRLRNKREAERLTQVQNKPAE